MTLCLCYSFNWIVKTICSVAHFVCKLRYWGWGVVAYIPFAPSFRNSQITFMSNKEIWKQCYARMKTLKTIPHGFSSWRLKIHCLMPLHKWSVANKLLFAVSKGCNTTDPWLTHNLINLTGRCVYSVKLSCAGRLCCQSVSLPVRWCVVHNEEDLEVCSVQ